MLLTFQRVPKMPILCADHPSEHWGKIYSDVWSMLCQEDCAQVHNLTGASVQLCCQNGQMVFHEERLRMFTTILDFDLTLDNIRELSNLWGTVKIIIPDMEIQIVQALGRLIYRGDTGNLTQEAMQEIMKYIRPAFGGYQV